MNKKRATSQDVANLAGVSRTTVSFVLNDVKGFNISPETRQKVRQAAESLNYIPDATAQALASRRAKAIGLVMTRSPHHIATDAFLPQIIGGLMEVIKDNKLRLLIEYVEVEHQDRVYLELARAKHIDGMILLTPRLDDAGLKKLEQVDIPTVLMGHLEGTNLHSVDVDTSWLPNKVFNTCWSWDILKLPVSQTLPRLTQLRQIVWLATKMRCWLPGSFQTMK